LTRNDLEHPAWQRELAERGAATGDALEAAGQHAAAIEAYMHAIAGAALLQESDPTSDGLFADISSGFARIARVHLGQGQVVDAIAAIQMKLGVDEKRMAAKPADVAVQIETATDEGTIAEALIEHGAAAAARPYLTRAGALLATATKAAARPADRQNAKELADSLRGLEATAQKLAAHK